MPSCLDWKIRLAKRIEAMVAGKPLAVEFRVSHWRRKALVRRLEYAIELFCVRGYWLQGEPKWESIPLPLGNGKGNVSEAILAGWAFPGALMAVLAWFGGGGAYKAEFKIADERIKSKLNSAIW